MPLTALALVLVLSGKPSPFFWPKPELVEEIDVPDVVKADGVPVRMHVVRSKLGIQQLLETFADAFVHAGFYVARVQKRHLAEPHVTGLDWRGLVSYTAILSPNEDGTTTCVLGEAALGVKKTAAQVPDFAPLPPGASEVMRVEQEGARIITFAVKGSSAEAVQRFYAQQLPRQGYRPSADRSEAWERDGAELSVMPSAVEGAVSVVLVQTRR
ncbi:MAG: hypothetical protein IPJ65_20210 [Archangiaceae bacterium]|nr:hypothetical protein [Archangiaceae bacterium]